MSVLLRGGPHGTSCVSPARFGYSVLSHFGVRPDLNDISSCRCRVAITHPAAGGATKAALQFEAVWPEGAPAPHLPAAAPAGAAGPHDFVGELPIGCASNCPLQQVVDCPDLQQGLESAVAAANPTERRRMEVLVAVSVLLQSPDRNSVLVTRRHPGMRTFPLQWVLPGGGLEESDSSLRAAAAREVLEETGLVVAENSLSYLALWDSCFPSELSPQSPLPKRHHLLVYFLATLSHDQLHSVTPQPTEVDAFAWIPAAALPDLLFHGWGSVPDPAPRLPSGRFAAFRCEVADKARLDAHFDPKGSTPDGPAARSPRGTQQAGVVPSQSSSSAAGQEQREHEAWAVAEEFELRQLAFKRQGGGEAVGDMRERFSIGTVYALRQWLKHRAAVAGQQGSGASGQAAL